MARLRRLACLAPVALAASACDNYMDSYYPPATPVNVAEVPVAPASDTYADTDPSALTDFHSTLDPHGQWAEDPTYGTVWAPNPAEVGSDFKPYETAGHWAYDDEDYVWVSDYDWGWAPYHYGRWVLSDTGWVWIPGREYAPAWVTWSVGYPGWPYVGWAPIYPAYAWRGGFAVGVVAVAPAARFSYCPQGAVFASNVSARVVSAPQAASISTHMGAVATAPAAGGHVATAPAAGASPAPSAHAAPAGMHGPPPSSIGIASENVTHVAPNDRGTAMAKSFAKPSTATKLGAHPPATQQYAKASSGARSSGGYHGASHSSGGFHGGGGGHR